MGFPSVPGDNLTYRWTNMVQLFYTTYTNIDLAHHTIFRAKIGKGGINVDIQLTILTKCVQYLIRDGTSILFCYILSLYANRIEQNWTAPFSKRPKLGFEAQ